MRDKIREFSKNIMKRKPLTANELEIYSNRNLNGRTHTRKRKKSLVKKQDAASPSPKRPGAHKGSVFDCGNRSTIKQNTRTKDGSQNESP